MFEVWIEAFKVHPVITIMKVNIVGVRVRVAHGGATQKFEGVPVNIRKNIVDLHADVADFAVAENVEGINFDKHDFAVLQVQDFFALRLCWIVEVSVDSPSMFVGGQVLAERADFAWNNRGSYSFDCDGFYTFNITQIYITDFSQFKSPCL